MTQRNGEADQRLLSLLVGLVVVLGAVALVISFPEALQGIVGDQSRPPLATAATVMGLVAIGTLINVQVRVRSTTHGIAWTDAALLVGLALMPYQRVVIVAALGMVIANFVRRRQVVKSAFGVAKEASCAFAGGLVLAAVGYTGSLDLAGLAALGMAFALMTVLDEAATIPVIALASRTRIRDRFRMNWDVRLVTAVGRFWVAVAAIWALQLQQELLYALPLAVLLAHVWHERWVRAREEREAWQNLAAATEKFTGVDLDVVLREGVTRGAKLFAADELEVEVWLGDNQRLVRGGEQIVYDGHPTRAPADDCNVYAVALHGYQGRRDIGVLRLRFRNKVKVTDREEAMAASYAAALDTAVRNAAAYQQLGEATQAHAYAAAHDALTGLPNRRELERQLVEALADPAAMESRIAMMIIDLRHFKEVNDALGHLAGDRVLVQVAQRLADAAGPNDLVARFGGDEFAVLLRSAWRPSRVEARATRVLKALAEPMEVDGLPILVEANGGVALALDPQDETDGDNPAAPAFRSEAKTWMAELMRRADVAMYQAKRRGRPLVSYAMAHDPADRDRLVLAGQLPKAVSQREFVLHFQPIVDLASGVVTGAEALARWRHPTRGELNPRWFLDLLERSTHLRAFTAAVLDDALGAAAIWRAAGHDLRVSVNISARSLLDASLPRQILSALDAHGCPPDRLCLELTETLALSQLDTVDQVLTQLYDIGVRLALDDFGTGFSSLAVLSRIPVHQLKIDRSFVLALREHPEPSEQGDGGGTDPATDAVALGQARAVVRSTVQLGRTLDLAVVAEGIETDAQRRLLWDLGCDAGQGHLFGRPQPAERLLAELTRGLGGVSGRLAEPLAGEGQLTRLRQIPGARQPGADGERSVG